MRFLVSLLGLIANRTNNECVITGSKIMLKRPIQDLLEALKVLGIRAESVKGNRCPPVKFSFFNFKTGRKTKLRGHASSQYLSSILLCAPYFDKDTTIKIIGELTSKPYIKMTIQIMRDFGVKVINQEYKKFIIKAGQTYKPRNYKIEPDASGASYFIAGAVLTGKAVKFPGLKINSKQGDVGFAALAAKMQNSKVQNPKDCLGFSGTGRELKGITVDLNKMPDMVPTLAVLAMFAKGRTIIKNVANLRIKETNRLKALVTEIKKFGIIVRELPDGLMIDGQPQLKCQSSNIKCQIRTYKDHRIAMAFAVAKLVCPDIIIENPQCVAKSFPGFWKEWRNME